MAYNSIPTPPSIYPRSIMYTDEERLYDDAALDFDNDNISIEETSSMDTEERDRKKRTELYRLTDPDYYSYKKKEYSDEGELQNIKVRIFSSPCQGKIRNATTGIRENEYVGTKFEELYFVVKDTSLYTKTYSNQNPRKLFYRNPEEFERHHNVTLSSSIKENWYAKNQKALYQ